MSDDLFLRATLNYNGKKGRHFSVLNKLLGKLTLSWKQQTLGNAGNCWTSG